MEDGGKANEGNLDGDKYKSLWPIPELQEKEMGKKSHILRVLHI